MKEDYRHLTLKFIVNLEVPVYTYIAQILNYGLLFEERQFVFPNLTKLHNWLLPFASLT